jgi:hypothetical protein
VDGPLAKEHKIRGAYAPLLVDIADDAAGVDFYLSVAPFSLLVVPYTLVVATESDATSGNKVKLFSPPAMILIVQFIDALNESAGHPASLVALGDLHIITTEHARDNTDIAGVGLTSPNGARTNTLGND